LTAQDIRHNGDRRDAALDALRHELQALRNAVVAEADHARDRVEDAHPEHRAGSLNLLHYLALRRRDLRSLQQRLAASGLSSLGRAEAHVLATLDAVLALLCRSTDTEAPSSARPDDSDFSAGRQRLARHTDLLLGPTPAERNVRIMVTMPSAAADDPRLVHDLLANGMDCIRINCAHDDAAAWSRIIGHLRRAEAALGCRCRVAMDLAGPKLRTGPLEPGPQVVRVRPRRDVFGHVVAPARIWLTPASAPRPAPEAAQACLAMPALWLARLREGDEVTLADARAAKRSLAVVCAGDDGCWLEADKTIYLVPGTVLRHRRRGHKGKGKAACVDAVPPRENAILLRKGDTLVLTRRLDPGRPAQLDDAERTVAPAMIGCTLPEVFDDVRAGEPI
jgi:pyruvate kinase